LDAEFVVAASHVLDERVTADDRRRGPIRSQTTIRCRHESVYGAVTTADQLAE
jgi:hypothetical protein